MVVLYHYNMQYNTMQQYVVPRVVFDEIDNTTRCPRNMENISYKRSHGVLYHYNWKYNTVLRCMAPVSL